MNVTCTSKSILLKVKSPFSLKEEHDDNTSSLLDALLRVSYFAPIVDIIQISYGMVYALCRSLTAQRLSMNNFDFNVLSVYTLHGYTTQHTVSCLAETIFFFETVVWRFSLQFDFEVGSCVYIDVIIKETYYKKRSTRALFFLNVRVHWTNMCTDVRI